MEKQNENAFKANEEEEVKQEVSNELKNMGINMDAEDIPVVKGDMITENILAILSRKEEELGVDFVIVDVFLEPKMLGSVLRFRKMYLKDNKWKRSLPEKIKLYVPELMTSQIVSMTMKRIIKETAVALGMKDIDIMLCFIRDFENGGVKIMVKHADLALYNQKEIDVLDINKIFG